MAGGSTPDLEELEQQIERVAFGSAKGGKKHGGPLTLGVARELGIEDMEAISNPSKLDSKPPLVKRMQASHHNLARLIAMGRPGEEVSLVTGYSSNYISILKANQDFQKLVDHYKGEKERIYVDVLERMKLLGLNSLDELQQRLDEKPEDWTKQQLMDLAKLTLGEAGLAKQEATKASSGQTVIAPVFNVNFVKADNQVRANKYPALADGTTLLIEQGKEDE